MIFGKFEVGGEEGEIGVLHQSSVNLREQEKCEVCALITKTIFSSKTPSSSIKQQIVFP